MRLSFKYLSLFTLLFIVEVGIARYVHDAFVRPYLGDAIVVVLIYAFIMGIIRVTQTLKNKALIAVLVLLFSFLIEGLQAASFIYKIGMGDMWWARLIFGTSFSWWDMLAYVGGFLSILLVEWFVEKKLRN